MLNRILQVALLSLMFSTAYGQTRQDSIKAFYPLQVGNYWEYGIQFPSAFQTVRRQVTADTLLANGDRFFVILVDDNYDHSYRDTLYERVTDEFEVLRYFSNANGSGEQLLYKLNAQTGDTWLSSDSVRTSEVKVDTVYAKEFLSETRIHKSLQTRPLHYQLLVHGIGFAVDSDELASDGLYLRGAIINGTRYGTITSVEKHEPDNTPPDFHLAQNYPNPFNASTTITFSLSYPQAVKIVIYNLTGREIQTLVDGILPSGTHAISWDGKNTAGRVVSANIYFLRLSAGDRMQVRKMLLLK